MKFSRTAVHAAFLLAFSCAALNVAAQDAASSDPLPSLLVADQPDLSRYTLLLAAPEQYRLRRSTEWQLRPPQSPQSVAAAAPAAPKLFTRRRFNQEVMQAATKAGIDPALVHAVISVESAYNAHATSPKGAVGLMQLMPGTARRYGIENPRLPAANIRGGSQYLSELLRMFKGDVPLALAAYNAGENAVLKYGNRIPPYPETMRYVPRVLGLYNALSAPALP